MLAHNYCYWSSYFLSFIIIANIHLLEMGNKTKIITIFLFFFFFPCSDFVMFVIMSCNFLEISFIFFINSPSA